MTCGYKDLAVVDDATERVVSSGLRVLHGWLTDADQTTHIGNLLAVMNLPKNAHIVDMGCGVGAFADVAVQIRPDLRFSLVNISQRQLRMCDQRHALVEADFHSTPLPDGVADAVLFSFSICHGDHYRALLEANRLLRNGGCVYIYDMLRLSGNNDRLREVLDATALTNSELQSMAHRAGFDIVECHTPPTTPVVPLMELLGPEVFAEVLDGVTPAFWSMCKLSEDDKVDYYISNYERIGFQFSGGRDSTAALYKIRRHWGKLNVYHLDTGDQFPETKRVFSEVRPLLEAEGARVHIIHSDVSDTRSRYGLASDLVPVDNTDVGRLVSGRQTRLISRYECCYRTLMAPMHKRIYDDGISLLIRGQRDDEYSTQPLRSGEIDNGVQVLYPIQAWSAAQVDKYLAAVGAPVAEFYARGVRRAPECMGCTAWWDEGRSAYLKQYHPEKHVTFIRNALHIKSEIDRQYDMLVGELSGGAV